MSTLRWSAAMAALGITALWLWHETRVADPERSSPPAAVKRDEPPNVAVRSTLSPSTRTVSEPARESQDHDQFADNGRQVKARFASERSEGAWATTTRVQLETELGKLSDKDASLRTVECRSSICRVEVAVASNAAGVAFYQSWMRSGTFDGPAYGTQKDGMMELFVGKPGTDLYQ